MEKIDIVLWIISGGFTIIFGLMIIMWNNISGRIDRLSEKVDDIDKRLCRIEGSLATQGHCLFNQSHNDKKAQ